MATIKKVDSAMQKGEDAQVKHLVETTDLSPLQARELIRRHGDNWAKIREEAKLFKAES